MNQALPSLRVLVMLLICVAMVVTSGACRDQLPLRTREGKPPNVLLITVDTLRTDRLGAYGHTIATSPSIDRLAGQGVRFARCVSSAPETAPAAATLITGLYQHHHRVFHNLATMPPQIDTLAERLKEAGYTTRALIGNFLLTEKYGFDQGFDYLESFSSPKSLTSSDDRGAALAADWLSSLPPEPWFLWVHFMDPHGPYNSAPPWWSEAFAYPDQGSGSADQPHGPAIATGDGNFGLGIIPRYQSMRGLDRLAQYVRRYDGEIRFTDAQIGKLVATLDWMGLRERTLVALTADHGESLTEHNEYLQHGWFLYDTTLHVPLILSWPDKLASGIVADEQVGGADLMPTILELVGVERHANALDGRSFADALFARPLPAQPPVYSVGPRKNQPFAISTGRYKLIHKPAGRPDDPSAAPASKEFNGPERIELYRLDEDPGEVHDLSETDGDKTSELLAAIREFERSYYLSLLNPVSSD